MDATYKKLLTFSYNLIGSYEDAKDIVQDALEKFIHLDKSRIEDEVNYLIRMVINLSINFKSKHQKHTSYGVWLPEPVSTESVEKKLVQEQLVNYSLLVLMENLNVKERAVFVLKEAFNYAHEEIAEALEITADNSRQAYSRAKKALSKKSNTPVKPGKHQLTGYMQAIMNADVKLLEQLFAEDIRIMADGGNKVRVVKDMEIGKEATAKLIQHVYALFLEGKNYSFEEMNHQPAIFFWKDNVLYNCQVFEFDEAGKINEIYSIVDPAKLKLIKSK